MKHSRPVSIDKPAAPTDEVYLKRQVYFMASYKIILSVSQENKERVENKVKTQKPFQ